MWGDLLKFTPPVYARRSANQVPNVGVEAPAFALNRSERLGVLYCTDDLQTIANNARITKETFDSRRGESGYSRRIKIGERVAIRIAFLENRLPTQASLRTFQSQKLEKNSVVVNRHTPFAVVIDDADWSSSPTTASEMIRRCFLV